MFCALSGEPPQVPVISSKSGHLYERRLIEKYIAENGSDPISGDKLSVEDLIAVKSSPNASAPRPPALTSIPALLHSLQNEWDALVLEQFSLKQQYNSVRQELSHALYQHDAATRVAARLLKERDSAREALASVQAAMGVAPTAAETSADVEMEAAPQETSGTLPADVDAEVVQTQQTLSAIRKKKAKPAATYASPAQVKTYTSKNTIPSLHASSPAGINALALSSANPTQFLTGGNDKIVQIYDSASNKVLSTLKGHTKKVHQVAWREKEGSNSLVMSGSADKTVRIWSHDSSSGEYAPAHTVKLHKGEITGLAVHPTSTILGVSSLDKTYSLHSLETFQTLFQSAADSSPYTSLSIHPDGVLVALGTGSASVKIYDIRVGSIAVELPASEDPEAASHGVNTSSFSENGFHFAFSSTPSAVAVWDLRKPKIINTLPFASADGSAYKINKIRYDLSSQFLTVAGSADLRVLANKTFDELAKFEASAPVMDFALGHEMKGIWSASGREVRVWGAPDA